jgi:DNA-binding MarR family transcriptional regulator
MTTQPYPSTELASRVWSAMYEFVSAQDSRPELQEALNLGRGMGHAKVLISLAAGPMTLSEIASAHGFVASYASVTVDKLVKRGLVERWDDPDDLRRKYVTLTASGWGAAKLAEQIIMKPPPALDLLPSNELAHLLHVLEQICTDVNQRNVALRP